MVLTKKIRKGGIVKLAQNNSKKRVFLKQKALEIFIKNKIIASSRGRGFSVVRIDPDNIMLEKYELKYYKMVLAVLQQRIENYLGLLEEEAAFCQSNEGNFLIFINKYLGEAELSELGWQIVSECCTPLDNADIPVFPEINAGLAVYPESGKSFDALLDSLNIAIIVSKMEGTNTFSVYTPKLTPEKSKEYKQLAGLKDGLNKKQFLLHYQPIIDLGKGEVCGVEALLRWNHPIHGIVSTRDFFDVIEASGEIYRLGLWTFEQMLEQRKAWRNQMPNRDLIYNINLSAKQLISPSLCDDIRRIAKKYPDLNPGEICFEISGATAFLRDEVISQNIDNLSKCGFYLAIDNYSPAHISFMPPAKPLDFIKISAKCHKSNDDFKSIKEMLHMGTVAGICFVAEGVENEEMLECARSLGIPRAQGFYFSRPVSAKECLSYCQSFVPRF